MFSMTREETAERFKYFLEQKGITPYYLDKRGIIPKATMYRILNCEVSASDETIKSFCRALEVTLEEYVGHGHAYDFQVMSPAQSEAMKWIEMGEDVDIYHFIEMMKEYYKRQ